MSHHVIKRVEDGKYVAKPGSEHSYTAKLENANVYPSKSAAETDRCVENEVSIPLSSILGIQ